MNSAPAMSLRGYKHIDYKGKELNESLTEYIMG